MSAEAQSLKQLSPMVVAPNVGEATPRVWSDLGAAIVLLFVAIPLSLGIAQASEAPLVAGLVAAVVGGIVVGALSRSTLSVSGPAAGLIMVLSGVQPQIGDWSAVLTAICLAGAIQIIAGKLRLGTYADFVPNTVIKGMSAAIGLVIIIKQLPHLLGYDADFEGDEAFVQANAENTFSSLWHATNAFTAGAVIVGITTLTVIFVWDSSWWRRKRLFGALPGAFIALVVGVLVSELLQTYLPDYALATEHMVTMPERAMHISEWFAFPDSSALLRWPVWKLAFTLFAVASLETLLSVRAADKLDVHRRMTSLNRELLAQGVGNFVSGMVGGLPVSSVIVRSSVNAAAGATSNRAVMLHGALIAILCLFLGQYLSHVPLAVLAGVLIFVGGKLLSPRIIREQIAAGADQLVPFVVTIGAILALDMLRGIFIGLITGMTFMLKSNFRTAISVTQDGRNHLIRLRKDVSFLNKPKLSEVFQSLPFGSDVIVDLTRADFIDRDIIELIAEFAREAPLKDIRVDIQANNERADVRERLRAFMLGTKDTERNMA